MQLALHFRPTQINVSTCQPKLFVCLLSAIEFKWWCLGGIEDFQLLYRNLDLSGRQLEICHTFASRLNNAFSSYYPFAADRPCNFVDLGLSLRIKHYLGQAFSVAQVNKYQISVVSVGLDPTGESNLFACIAQPKLTTGVCSFEHSRNLSKKPYLSTSLEEGAVNRYSEKKTVFVSSG